MTEQDQARAQTAARNFSIQRLYLKDLSFESPTAPNIFRGEWKPESNLNLNSAVNALDDNNYEVVLTLTLTTKVGEQTAYLVEVQQAGIFTLQGFSDQEKAPMLGAYCPNLLFAYAREAVTDLVAKGSFPQMVLQPVNFDALFLQHQQELARRAQETQGKGEQAHTVN